MPRVPYVPYPTAQLPAPGTERISVETPPATFGANIGAGMESVGRALDHLGATWGEVGKEATARAIGFQDLTNETLARNADSEYTRQQDQMLMDIRKMQGMKASDALKDFGDRSEALRQKVRASLPNADAQRRFDSTALGVMNRNIFSASVHAASEYEKAVDTEASAARSNATNIVTDPNDPKEKQDKQDAQAAARKTQADLHDWGPERKKLEEANDNSDLEARRIHVLGTNGYVDQAFDALEKAEKNGEMTAKAVQTTREFLVGENISIGTKVLVGKIYDPTNKSVEAMHAEIDKLAPKYAHAPEDSANFSRFTENAHRFLDQKLYTQHRLQTELDNQNRNIISTGIVNDRFTDIAGLKNDPEAGPAFFKLSAAEQLKIERELPGRVEAHYQQSDENSMRALAGLRQRDPDAYQAIDPYDRELHLSKAHIKETLNNQRADIKQPYQDPHVRWGKQIIDQMYPTFVRDQEVRYAPKPGADPGSDQVKNYDAFTGRIKAAIDAWKDDHDGKPPSATEFKEKIAPSIVTEHSEDRWLLGNYILGKKTVPDFLNQIPQADIDKAKEEVERDYRANGINQEANPDAIKSHILIQQWKDFYQKQREESKSKGPTRGRPRVEE